MRIVKLEEIGEELQRHLKAQELFPIVGSGFTKGCKCGPCGDNTVPSGTDMKDYMFTYLSQHGYPIQRGLRFSKLAHYYETFASKDDYWKYFRDNFTRVQLPASKIDFLNINWKFIYTLNLDDAVERNSDFSMPLLPNKELRLDAIKDMKCVFKLHGDALELLKYESSDNKVLGLTEYILSLDGNKSMLQKLTTDLNYSNVIFVGCSLDDELDLLSVAQHLKQQSTVQRNRYYVTNTEPNDIQIVDLEDFGIDTVIVVPNYDRFYSQFAALSESCSYVSGDELTAFHQLPIKASPKKSSEDYLLSGKFLFDKKKKTVYYPPFFIERDIEETLLSDMDTICLQILHGSRVSGKSYLLAGLLRKIRNKDIFYFDSRSHVDKDLLEQLLQKTLCTILIDTNVLTKSAVKYLFDINYQQLHENGTNVVLCVNNSDQDTLRNIRYSTHSNQADRIRTYEVKKRLSTTAQKGQEKSELDRLNSKLKTLGFLPFSKSETILDNLIRIREEMCTKKPNFFDEPVKMVHGDSDKMSLLLLLAQNEKASANEIVACGLIQKNAELLHEHRIAIEEDHCDLLSINSLDKVSYQVVCNAKVWLLNQIRNISSDSDMEDTIVEAFCKIVQTFLDCSKSYKSVEDYVKFDKLNELFPDGKRIIVRIYEGLRPILNESYQYYHQYAKCRSWGMSGSGYDRNELDAARIAALTALHMVQECDIESSPWHRMAYAHILHTLTIIYAKLCFMENFQNVKTVERTITYFEKAYHCYENYSAMQIAKSRVKKRDEEGGVVKKWVNKMMQDNLPISRTSRSQLQNILSFWMNLSTTSDASWG